MRATDGNSQSLLLRAIAAGRPESAVVVSSIVFAFAIGAFLAIRRAVGALTTPVPVTELVATAAGVCVWAVALRWIAAKPQAVVWVMLGVLLLFAIGCSYPGDRLVDWLVWLAAGGLIVWAPSATRVKRKSQGRRDISPSDSVPSGEQVLQQQTRIRTADGRETISGTMVAEFAPGERQVTVYAGFCPPFELLPQVDANVADDSGAEVKLVQVLHNGAQLDVRLSEPAEEPVSVTIEFSAG